jgi:hypothetical protein
MLVEALATCAAGKHAWVRPYVRPDDGHLEGNQFLLMVKPEVAAPGGDPEPALGRLWEILAEHDVSVGAIRVFTSEYVEQRQLIAEHYPTLNAIARLGLDGMSPAARSRLYERFPEVRDGRRRIVGAFELLAMTDGLTPYTLDVLSRNISVQKLGTGAYAMPLRLDDQQLLVLNPFHPQQIAHFAAPGGAIALIECWCAGDMADIRRYVVGSIDPHDAEIGSVRRVFADEQDKLGLSAISTRRNGVHSSPGPVEAMATIMRYFSDAYAPIRPADTVFGQQLHAAGALDAAIAWALTDPYVETLDHQSSLFEITEDLNWDAAADLVRDVSPY